MRKRKIGLVLSGGGARGLAHIGVLKALEDHGIEIDMVSGASAGSIVGALFASGKTPSEMMEIAENSSSLLKIFNFRLPVNGLSSLKFLQEMLEKNIAEDSFESLQKKLFVAVSNFNTGKLEIKSSGKLFEVVKASSSIPVIFKPIEINGQLYVDGGLMENFPVFPLKEHCDFIIGVNVMPVRPVSVEAVDGIKSIALRTFEMAIWNNTKDKLKDCDIVIEPQALIDFSIYDFKQFETLHDIGYQATFSQMAKIEALIQ